MNFPVWELELGGGMLIAIVAIIHVYISHFAIGGGLFLVITEHYAYRIQDQYLINYVKTHSRFFALVTLVAGTLTGVGIWFTIGLVSPSATSALIRTFVWGWATEWVFFFVEIAAAIFYYTTWEKVSRRTHLAYGWIYFAAAFMSLVVINGILSFMLTPGRWIETQNFWHGFYNPTYPPSLVTRTAICVMLAGVYAFLTGHFIEKRSTRARLMRYAGIWGLTGTVLAVPGMWWYYSNMPAGSAELIAGGLPVAGLAVKFLAFGGLALAIMLLIAIFLPRKFKFGSALLTAAIALTVFGAFEWTREAIRKPYIIYDYMYGNGLRPNEYDAIREKGGILASAVWVSNREQRMDSLTGREVFRIACRSCHTISGYNGLSGPLSGLDQDYIGGLMSRLEYIKGSMPPFPGSETEAGAAAAYLYNQTDPSPPVTGEEAFEKRCTLCHTADGGFRPLRDFMDGMSREDISDMIPLIADLTEAMPPWTGTGDDVTLITDYIISWFSDDSGEPEGGQ